MPHARPHPRPARRPGRAVTAAATALTLAAALGGCSLITARTGPHTLTVADYYTAEPGNTALTEILDECGARIGVDVVREVMPRSQLVPKLLRDGAAGTLPDLVLSDNPDLPKLASTGALLPLDDEVDTEGFYDSVLDTGRYDGELYGVAPGVNGLALFYDREVFAEAGLEPPTTWEELRRTAAALTEGHRYGLALSAIGTEEGTWQFEPFLWGAGAELTDLDSPEAVTALSFWGSLFDDGSVSASALNWSQSDVAEQFAGGHAAMMINGSWQLAALDAYEDLDYGVVPLPTLREGGEPATPMGGEAWAVPRGDKQDKAVQLLNCVLEPDNMYTWSRLRADVPSHPDVAERLLADQPDLAPFVESAPTARSRTVELGTAYPAVAQALSTAMHQVATGGASPAEALAAAQREAESGDE
ncbi:sugar ABC transporter substrate-binding protein [Streptomyces sp. 7-21]|jgi:multiple sugar transport system substrate-binding protein|uniref:sugar ABC transporter substrate-binding protein n=1 Tax=Streptomyces sp. 7-21 TaxID=2802283 RepID=UPI00191E14D6|nr:sugar ABC transporter substrate-binding protein [Streptomyces sp. 7-21]MBL1068176.1 sugar ABC transporter substrate-binding protein [Streptomyces sp. 7-21]